ncbi:MAG: hypothetical protein K0S65_822 [Labilithrix sp.]|nr:hypothetical protein [Labilithrix sp.]
MKRLVSAPALLVVLALSATAYARADFDPALNGLRITPGALKAIDFESAEGLAGVELTSWAETQGYAYPQLNRTKITGAEQLGDRFTGAASAIEGSHALRLGDGNGIAITDEALFGQVKDGRFEVSLWARADGAGPVVQVLYDREDNVYGGRPQFALVRAIRTGRETTDGWAEYATGALDGSVWGVPARAVVVLPTTSGNAKASFLIDALEIRAVDGKPVAPIACTQANVDSACGAEGDCMFGHCVSSTVTWGANPPAAHRAEIAERWVQFGTRFIGDRNAAQNGATILAPQARELAQTAPSSRQFYGGLNRLVNLLRDNHTSFGSPSNYTSFAPQVQQGSSSIMGACFGVVEKDLMGGGLGFAVFRATEDPDTGTRLATGDVLVEIDGKDPKAWVDDVWPRFATTLPNDPRSDWGAVASDLSSLITKRASTVTLERCASASSCGPEARQKITVDIASVGYAAVTSPAESSGSRLACSQRFTDSVTVSGEYTGEDIVSTVKGSAGETRVQFDGFVGEGTWQNSMTNIFTSGAKTVLMDARMGHGGYYTTVEHLFHLLRGTSEPMGVFSVGRGSYDMVDPPSLLGRLSSCAGNAGELGDFWGCYASNANGFFAQDEAPPGAATKIAWLNTRDVSANDFMPRLLKGRTGIKIFAPHPTSGAFGAVLQLPSVASGWSGASLQIQDARFAPAIDQVGEVRWESGHGVEPDVVVVQKLSDALSGVDTIVTTATAWLAAP